MPKDQTYEEWLAEEKRFKPGKFLKNLFISTVTEVIPETVGLVGDISVGFLKLCDEAMKPSGKKNKGEKYT